MELAGKVVIVTGAAGNLGSACALQVAREGAQIVLTDLPGTGVKELAEQITGAVAHEGDVSQEQDVVDLVEMTRRRYGRVDVLVNAAAAMSAVRRDQDLESMEVEVWEQIMGVNVQGAMLTCKHVIPSMAAQGSGSIVNFSSTAGFLGDQGLIGYATSKAALIGLTRAVATTYGKSGIRCNAVAPGSVWSETTKARFGPERVDLAERTRLTPRLGVPSDVAHMVVFLASEKASYVTGQTILVDGGGTAHQPWVNVK